MSSSPRLGFVQCISPSGLHRMAYHEWGDPQNPRVLVCQLAQSLFSFGQFGAFLVDDFGRGLVYERGV